MTYGDLVLRPAGPELSRKQLLLPWLFVGGLFVLPGTVMVGISAGPLWALAVVALVGVLVLLGWASTRGSRITVTADEIAVTGLVYRKRVPRARTAQLVRAFIVQPRGPVIDTVFVLDARGKVAIRISGYRYRRTDIDRLVRVLGLPTSRPEQAVTANQLSAAYPGLVPWYEAHPVALGAIGALALIGFATMITVVIMLLG